MNVHSRPVHTALSRQTIVTTVTLTETEFIEP
jgi:hypothetical protein